MKWVVYNTEDDTFLTEEGFGSDGIVIKTNQKDMSSCFFNERRFHRAPLTEIPKYVMVNVDDDNVPDFTYMVPMGRFSRPYLEHFGYPKFVNGRLWHGRKLFKARRPYRSKENEVGQRK